MPAFKFVSSLFPSRQAARVGSICVLLPFSYDNCKSTFMWKDFILSYESVMNRETFSWFNRPNISAQYAVWFNFSSRLDKSLNSNFSLLEKNTANFSCKSCMSFKTFAFGQPCDLCMK
jgi:hypothetical protein